MGPSSDCQINPPKFNKPVRFASVQQQSPCGPPSLCCISCFFSFVFLTATQILHICFCLKKTVLWPALRVLLRTNKLRWLKAWHVPGSHKRLHQGSISGIKEGIIRADTSRLASSGDFREIVFRLQPQTCWSLQVCVWIWISPWAKNCRDHCKTSGCLFYWSEWCVQKGTIY